MSPLTLACQRGSTYQIWSLPSCCSRPISHTAAQLHSLSTNCSHHRPIHGTFHHHSSLLDQLLTRPVKTTLN